jgi:hypothetical protein
MGSLTDWSSIANLAEMSGVVYGEEYGSPSPDNIKRDKPTLLKKWLYVLQEFTGNTTFHGIRYAFEAKTFIGR